MEFSWLGTYKSEVLETQQREHVHRCRSTVNKSWHFKTDTLSIL